MQKLAPNFALIMLGAFSLSAQTEIKINPLGMLFASPDVALEFAANESIGIEPTIGVSFPSVTIDGTKLKSTGFQAGVLGKYYFGPEKGIVKFYAGLYTRMGTSKFSSEDDNGTEEGFNRFRLAIGITTGYKWVSKKNVVFELGLGTGRNLTNKFTDNTGSFDTSGIPFLNFDLFLRLVVGYRFGGGSNM